MEDEAMTFINIIKNWKQQTDSKVTSVLMRLQSQKIRKTDILDKALQCVMVFHKQICKAQKVPQQWFEIVKTVKKQLNKLGQQMKKKNNKKPILEKRKSTVVEFPPQLLLNKTQSEQNIMKYLYKSFINNFENTNMTQKIVPFLEQLYLYLKSQLKDKQFEFKRKIQRICSHLDRESSKQVKIQMLQGKKTAKQVADNPQEAFQNQQQKQFRKQVMRQHVKACDTQFYKDMKKNINKDASQQCRFCKKPSAYCEDMKQIRASDQPMTRFMKCNNCGKNWRD